MPLLAEHLRAPLPLHDQWVLLTPDLLFNAILLALLWFSATGILTKTLYRHIATILNVEMGPLLVHLSEGITYLIFVVASLCVIPQTKCFHSRDACFLEAEGPSTRLDIALLYCLQMGGYLHMLLVRFAVPRLYPTDDSIGLTGETLVHHAITLLLLLGSWMGGFTAIGSLVFFLHDPSSVWLKVARVAERTAHQRVKAVALRLFAGCFLLFRIAGIPLLILRPTILYGPPTHALRVLFFLLLLLYGINCLWAFKILAIMLRPLFASPPSRDEAAVKAQGVEMRADSSGAPK